MKAKASVSCLTCRIAEGTRGRLPQDGCKAICGDGVVLGEEQCDPPMEGCDQQCKLEIGWKWVQNKATTTCGDSVVAGKEPRANVAFSCADVRGMNRRRIFVATGVCF